jgi:ribosomal protein S1
LKARHALLGWLACASAALGGGIAMASAMPGDVVTGTITAINGTMVNIQGQVYSIAAASAAYSVVQTFKPGQIVDVQLNGPAKSSASQVVNITLHSGD